MSRKKKEMTVDELLEERAKIDKQLTQLREKENAELGILVKKIFGDFLPNDKTERIAFFKQLYAYCLAKQQSVDAEV